MRSRPQDIAPVPLFDRLEDREPGVVFEVRPRRTLSAEGLRASLLREIGLLLATRRSVPTRSPGAGGQTVLDFGLPELSWFAPADVDRRARLARIVAATIAAHEPRLTEVEVELEPDPDRPPTLHARIAARLGATLGGERIVLGLRWPVEAGGAAAETALSDS